MLRSFGPKLVGASAVIAATISLRKREEFQSNCDSADNKNYAFVFIKPHANTTKTQQLVQETLKKKGINVIAQGELTAEQIDKGMLIDQHYYAIGK